MTRAPTPAPRAPRAGLSLVETLLAIAILGIVSASVLGLFATNLQSTRASSERTQATLLLNYFGRRVVGGESSFLPAANGTTAWDYGDLSAAFPDLDAGSSGDDTDRFRVAIDNEGTVTFANASATRYRISVCFRGVERESCLQAVTVGPAPGSGSAPSLGTVN